MKAKRQHRNKYAGMAETTSDRRTRWRKRALVQYVMCVRKQPYSTQAQAEHKAKSKATPLRAYHCPLCGHWHLTKRLEVPA